MAEIFDRTISRRAFVRGVGLSIPAISVVVFTAPDALASPPGCDDPSGMVDNCAVQLPEEFTSTSFSTTAIAGGTNYSILFSTKISSGPVVPKGATGYRIRSTSVAGQKRDGTPFSLKPAIGEAGPRVLGARSASSLGFSLDVLWSGAELVRTFDYTYDVAFLNGLTEIQTCTYMTVMTLVDNGLTLGGVGSVTFSPPRLTVCAD